MVSITKAQDLFRRVEAAELGFCRAAGRAVEAKAGDGRIGSRTTVTVSGPWPEPGND